MPTKKDFDSYIANAAPFARPLLKYFRSCVHEACPEVEESFKWSMPHFNYKDNILCHMAAFKNHTSYSFWLAGKMKDSDGVFVTTVKSGMGHFGKVTSLDQIPDKQILIKYIKEAMALIDAGEKLETAGKKKPEKHYVVPEIMIEALEQNTRAMANYMAMSISKKNDYIEWVVEAKTETTQKRRLQQMIEWLEEGKPRNWKYLKEYQ